MPKTNQQDVLNDKDEVYTLKLTEWQRNALIQLMQNANYVGKDIVGVAKLLQKINDVKKQ